MSATGTINKYQELSGFVTTRVVGSFVKRPPDMTRRQMQDQQLRVSLDDLERPRPQPKCAEDFHEVLLGIGRHLNNETLALKTIYDRLLAIEHHTKRRGSREFVRYLVGVCIGVAAILAWLSYGEAAKQIIAARALQLGWSPETKRLIASWVSPENASARSSVPGTPPPAPVTQTMSEAVAPKAPGPSIDSEQLHQMAADLAAVRHIVEQLATGQDQVAREITGLQKTSDQQILEKMIPPSPPPRPVAAPARRPTPIGSPRSRAPMPPYGPPPYGPPPYGPPPYGPPLYGPAYQ
jgi:hypothetical protein